MKREREREGNHFRERHQGTRGNRDKEEMVKGEQ